MLNIIGAVAAALGAGLLLSEPSETITAIAGFMLIIGTLVATSVKSTGGLTSYAIPGDDHTIVLVRKRYYLSPLPLVIVFQMLTLGKLNLRIPWKQEYYSCSVDEQGETIFTKIPRKEYIALRNEQRRIYTTETLDREFIQREYNEEYIGYKRKKNRLITVIILAALTLSMATEPVGVYLALIYEAIFVPMIILWFPDYKDARIMKKAYERTVGTGKTA